MKLLKGARSFRKSKKKASPSDVGSPASQSIDPASPGSDALMTDSPRLPPASDMGDDHPPEAVAITPPDSPRQDSPASSESRQDGPSSPSSPASPKSLHGTASSLRPLRLGSFNFDNPANNASFESEQSPQTRSLSFPPLFAEADDMLNLSNLIYTLAELRDLARNGVLNDPAGSSRILDLPLPLESALKIISSEGELLRDVLDDGKHEATLSALESLLERQRERMEEMQQKEARAQPETAEGTNSNDAGMFGWMTKWDGCLAGGFSFDELFCGDLSHVMNGGGDMNGAASPRSSQQTDSSMITAVGDLNNDEELVYAVGINPVEERITVIFRGSVTQKDFMTDAKISIAKIPDPSKFHGTNGGSSDDDDGDVGVHQGFYDYLFGPASKGGKSKYAEIMQHINQLIMENPARQNYKLYVTGHSLGGALATLFGFYVAASPNVALPVTIVSIASPRVGNLAFARTFAEMESQGKLRHLRIANHKDPVTLGPTVSSKRALALSAKAFSPLGYLALMVSGNGEGGDEEIYYHTGMKMKLFKNVSAVGSQRCMLSYSGHTIISGSKKPVAIDKEDMAEIEQSNKRKKKDSSSELPMVSYHYGTSYSERLAAAESDLRGMTLNGLYREKAGAMPWVV